MKSRSGTPERLFLGDVVGEGGTAVVRECRPWAFRSSHGKRA